MLATPWYRWFAWYPVLIDGKFVWFKTIERRDCETRGNFHWSSYRHVRKSRSAWFAE